MKAVLASIVLLASSAAFASEQNGALYDQYTEQYGAQRVPVCTGVKILGTNEGENFEVYYDLSEAQCQPGKIWTQQDYQDQTGGHDNQR